MKKNPSKKKKKATKTRFEVPKAASRISIPKTVVHIDDPLLTPEEVAPILRYKNKRAVLEMISLGRLKAINLKEKGESKNQYRVRLSDLNMYIKTL